MAKFMEFTQIHGEKITINLDHVMTLREMTFDDNGRDLKGVSIEFNNSETQKTGISVKEPYMHIRDKCMRD